MSLLREHCEPQTSWRTAMGGDSSDWTIKVTNEEDGSVFSYHVHQAVLGTKSKYFRHLFENSKKNDSHFCEVPLQARVAEAFPEMLDYLYKGNYNYSFNTCLVSLLVLAEYFIIDELREDVITRIKLLKEGAAYQLLYDAYYLQCKAAIEVVLQVLKSSKVSLFNGVTSDHLLALTPAAFNIIFNLMFKRELGFLASSEDLSLAMAVYLESLPESAQQWKLLASLTNSDIMPTISPNAAFFFLNLTSNAADSNADAVKSLEHRCLVACEKWQEYSDVDELFRTMTLGSSDSCIDQDDLYMTEFCCLPESIKVKVLQSALKGCFSPAVRARKKERSNKKVNYSACEQKRRLSPPTSNILGDRSKAA